MRYVFTILALACWSLWAENLPKEGNLNSPENSRDLTNLTNQTSFSNLTNFINLANYSNPINGTTTPNASLVTSQPSRLIPIR
ncbi:MAG: hypothetical protein HYR96_10025 [Deltaproteobacteria bacterium]|nr:hypothetical protein [Deltaproteobacteria bacterium]